VNNIKDGGTNIIHATAVTNKGLHRCRKTANKTLLKNNYFEDETGQQ
jgi:hypothetical protein